MWGSWVNRMGSPEAIFGSRRLPSSPSVFVPPAHTVENPGKGRVRGHVTCLPHLPGILRSSTIESMSSTSRGIVGPDAKAIGPRPAQHLSGPRGAHHDACADPRDALKNKTARTTSRTSRQLMVSSRNRKHVSRSRMR